MAAGATREGIGSATDPAALLENSALVTQAVARAKEGDMTALHFLYVRYADPVRGYIGSIVRDSHEAEDITQTLFLNLLKKIHRYERREVPFAAWILRVARNAALDHLRSRRAVPVEEVRKSEHGHEEGSFERQDALKNAFATLPVDQREVLVLRHIGGLSPTEIARRIHKTESSVHGLHHRGRNALKAALRDVGAAPVTAA
jgi:RNA polymerase sigma-70 factor (ECF subfamily)